MQRKLLLSCGLMPFLIETGIFRVRASLWSEAQALIDSAH